MVDRHDDRGARGGDERHGAGLREVDPVDAVEAGRHADGPLGVADLGRPRRVELHRRADALPGEGVGLDGGHEPVGEEAADVLEPEAVVAAVPGSAVPAPVLDPEGRRRQHGRITDREPRESPGPVHRRRPGRAAAELRGVGHHEDQVGVAAPHRKPRAVDLGRLLEQARHPREVGERRPDGERLIFAVGRVAEDARIGHADPEGAHRHRDRPLLVGQRERGVVAERRRAREALDAVAAVDDRLAGLERERLRDLAGADGRVDRERERLGPVGTAAVGAPAAAHERPGRGGRLAVRHVPLPLEGRAVAAEGEAEEVAAQRNEHGGGQVRGPLVLPGAHVIGLERPAAPVERDRRHVAAESRHRHLDVVVGEDVRGLRVDLAQGRGRVFRTGSSRPDRCHEESSCECESGRARAGEGDAGCEADGAVADHAKTSSSDRRIAPASAAAAVTSGRCWPVQ